LIKAPDRGRSVTSVAIGILEPWTEFDGLIMRIYQDKLYLRHIPEFEKDARGRRSCIRQTEHRIA
jgi:hypothetical protein